MNVTIGLLNTLELFFLDGLYNRFESFNSLDSPLDAENASQNLQQSKENKATGVQSQVVNSAHVIKEGNIVPVKHNEDKEGIA